MLEIMLAAISSGDLAIVITFDACWNVA
jgi:hypothetical protein